MASLKVPLQTLPNLTISIVAKIRIIMEVLGPSSLLFLSVVYGRVVTFVTVVAVATIAFADRGCERGVE